MNEYEYNGYDYDRKNMFLVVSTCLVWYLNESL